MNDTLRQGTSLLFDTTILKTSIGAELGAHEWGHGIRSSACAGEEASIRTFRDTTGVGEARCYDVGCRELW
jgi:hypothetical protein